MLKVNSITEFDTNNGPGFRTSVWIQGCSIRCPGCHNVGLWENSGGIPWRECFADLMSKLEKPHCDGLSILGGEPIKLDDPEAINDLTSLCGEVKHNGINIWLWTGYVWEQIKDLAFIKYIDVLVDGPYKINLRDTSLAFRGSSNQRLIDVFNSLNLNKEILYNI